MKIYMLDGATVAKTKIKQPYSCFRVGRIDVAAIELFLQVYCRFFNYMSFSFFYYMSFCVISRLDDLLLFYFLFCMSLSC